MFSLSSIICRFFFFVVSHLVCLLADARRSGPLRLRVVEEPLASALGLLPTAAAALTQPWPALRLLSR